MDISLLRAGTPMYKLQPIVLLIIAADIPTKVPFANFTPSRIEEFAPKIQYDLIKQLPLITAFEAIKI